MSLTLENIKRTGLATYTIHTKKGSKSTLSIQCPRKEAKDNILRAVAANGLECEIVRILLNGFVISLN
jgi:hypothetical protein